MSMCVIYSRIRYECSHRKSCFVCRNRRKARISWRDSVFQAEGLAIFWAILKGEDDEHSLVYIKLISTAAAQKPFQHYHVLAVNPFSKEEEWVIKGEKFAEQNLLKLNRAAFRNKMERRFFFYTSEKIEEDQKPDMIVYYQGIPDTAPEFLEETQIEQYFENALARLKKK